MGLGLSALPFKCPLRALLFCVVTVKARGHGEGTEIRGQTIQVHSDAIKKWKLDFSLSRPFLFLSIPSSPLKILFSSENNEWRLSILCLSMASSSSSSSAIDWKYDVFLNFRGEDTRKTFIGHLYKALVHNSINTFIDAQELRKGNGLSQLLKAISGSRLSIVVFSQNYASSRWCLKELVHILHCMDTHELIVVPIFYGVDPSHVRKLKGSFAEAFSKHEHDSNAGMEEVQGWSSALRRNLSELHLDWFVYSTKFEKPTELDSSLDSTTSNNLTEHEGYIQDHRTFTNQYLQQLPHVSGIAIKELPSVIYNLTGIVTLTLRYSKGFKSLTSRNLSTQFEVFPDIVENMERLASLDLDETSIRELPQSIERLQGLVSLNLKNCKNLVYLPDSICNLLSLEWLTLSGCSKLSKLPEDLLYLKRLDVKGTGKKQRYFSTLGELAQFRSTAPLIDIAGSNNNHGPTASHLSTLGDSVQFQSTVLLSVMVDEENEAVAVGETLSDLEESSYKEEEEKALAASRRGGRIWGCCICGARANED
ncbi:hypothetical protein DVH24_037105 [Malus domestica]|uniref:ADP-ribosyl cyclase/cyclic ADP-ribose hydrolase n=1 Tax=Malus domestica TaxID=3750 RepID=A0A498HJK3_MALDO|nr:hypothetical protein DVH24_037105 [Malus domestica]